MFSCLAGGEKGIEISVPTLRMGFSLYHDLEELVSGLKGHGVKIPPEVDEAIVLTSFAWEARYPGLAEPVTREEYQEALRHAEAVVGWAEHEIGAR